MIHHKRSQKIYLLQHAVPSEGCAQHAPSFSSFVLLGVQQEVSGCFVVQHEELFVFAFTKLSLLFSRRGIPKICVSITKVFSNKDGNSSKKMQLSFTGL